MSSRTEKTKKYMAARARPREWKEVTVSSRNVKEYKPKEEYPKIGETSGGDPIYKIRAGYCPCAICGHKWMWECEENDCQCCSNFCT